MAVRWHALFVQKAKGIGLAESQLALAALVALVGPGAEVAAATLAQLARTFGVNGIEAVLRRCHASTMDEPGTRSA